MREREEDYPLDALSLYLKEAGKHPLLTREQEVELSKQHHQGRKAEVRLKELEKDGLKPEERSRLESLISQGSKAKETLVKSNFRLVISIAKGYRGRGMDFQDLFQEGNIGLMKAIDKFDPKRGNKFSTYATWWIRQALSRAVADQGRTIRVPVHASEEQNQLQRIRAQLTEKLGREPITEELAKELGLPEKKVKKIQSIPAIVISLDMPIGEDKGSYLGEFIEDVDGLPPSDEAAREVIGKQLREAVDSLTDREAEVLRLRFGLEDGNSRTLEEVGREVGVTRERVRQIQAEALRKLRHPSRARKLEEYLR